MSRQEIGTMLRIGMLYNDLFPNEKVDFSPKGVRTKMNNVRLTYKIGPDRVKRALSIMNKLRHPLSWASPQAREQNKISSLIDSIPWKSIMMASSAARRTL